MQKKEEISDTIRDIRCLAWMLAQIEFGCFTSLGREMVDSKTIRLDMCVDAADSMSWAIDAEGAS